VMAGEGCGADCGSGEGGMAMCSGGVTLLLLLLLLRGHDGAVVRSHFTAGQCDPYHDAE